jgi:hypothetical protein
MKFLLDTSEKRLKATKGDPLIQGQLLTPLTNYKWWGGIFAIDNGAFSGFDHNSFERLLSRLLDKKTHCLFAAVPDVVGNARRTLEVFHSYSDSLNIIRQFPTALVIQDGQEDLPIPWEQLSAIFIGGTNSFKDSSNAYEIVKAAKILKKHVHVGRVNSVQRFNKYQDAGADTCDGTGVVKFTHQLSAIAMSQKSPERQQFLINEFS